LYQDKNERGIKMFNSFSEMVENTTYTVETPKCFHCGSEGSVDVPMEGFLRRQLGALIQDAYPELSVALREQLMTGTHPECWEEVYGSCE
jgi:hypothetical protein